jgi:hypothetical protein
MQERDHTRQCSAQNQGFAPTSVQRYGKDELYVLTIKGETNGRFARRARDCYGVRIGAHVFREQIMYKKGSKEQRPQQHDFTFVAASNAGLAKVRT